MEERKRKNLYFLYLHKCMIVLFPTFSDTNNMLSLGSFILVHVKLTFSNTNTYIEVYLWSSFEAPFASNFWMKLYYFSRRAIFPETGGVTRPWKWIFEGRSLYPILQTAFVATRTIGGYHTSLKISFYMPLKPFLSSVQQESSWGRAYVW